jgi:putative endonuclease
MMMALRKLADRARYRARRRQGRAAAALGAYGEDLAHRYLQSCGLTIIARNYRMTGGGAETDIVAREGEALVFVEVKTRDSSEFGPPERAVGIDKQRHMVRAALDYARRADIGWQQIRFDIVSVVAGDPPEITHLRDVLPLRRAPGD